MAKVRKISKADKDKAVKNLLLDNTSKPVWKHIMDVTEKDGITHQEFCNGYSLIRFNDGVITDFSEVENYSIDLNTETEETKGFKDVFGAEGVMKTAKRDCTMDITNKLPSFDDMTEYCKTTNHKSKFLKEHFGLKTLPLAFTDRADNYSGDTEHQHLFNMLYIYRALLICCSTFQTEYKCYVKEGYKISFMLIVGDIATAVILPMRIQNNPMWKIETLNKAYDDFEKVVTAISDEVYNRVSDTENPIEHNYEFRSFKDTMTIEYDKKVFKNTVEFFIKEYFDSDKALYNDDMEKLKDNQQTITDTLVKLYCDCYYKYKKGYQKIIDGFAKLNKTPDFDTMLKEFFITTMYKDYHSVLKSLTCVVSIGQSIKIYNKYYKGSAA